MPQALAAIPAMFGTAGAAGAATGATAAGAGLGGGVTAAGLGSGAIGAGLGSGATMAGSAIPIAGSAGAGMGGGALTAAPMGLSMLSSGGGPGSMASMSGPNVGGIANQGMLESVMGANRIPVVGEAMQGNPVTMETAIKPPSEISQAMAPYQGMMRGETPSLTSFAPPPQELQSIMGGLSGGGTSLTPHPGFAYTPPMPPGQGLIPGVAQGPMGPSLANATMGGPGQAGGPGNVAQIPPESPWTSNIRTAAQVMGQMRNPYAQTRPAPSHSSISTVAKAPDLAMGIQKRLSPVERYLTILRR
jgi:hypothetical protein